MNIDTYLIATERTVKDLADSLGIPPPLLSQWRTGVRQVPAERCPAIERATNGAVTCEELRPDVDWAYLRRCNHGPIETQSLPSAALQSGANQ